jgi:hypothetical protein
MTGELTFEILMKYCECKGFDLTEVGRYIFANRSEVSVWEAHDLIKEFEQMQIERERSRVKESWERYHGDNPREQKMNELFDLVERGRSEEALDKLRYY